MIIRSIGDLVNFSMVNLLILRTILDSNRTIAIATLRDSSKIALENWFFFAKMTDDISTNATQTVQDRR